MNTIKSKIKGVATILFAAMLSMLAPNAEARHFHPGHRPPPPPLHHHHGHHGGWAAPIAFGAGMVIGGAVSTIIPPPPPRSRIWIPGCYVTEYDAYGRPFSRWIPGHWEWR